MGDEFVKETPVETEVVPEVKEPETDEELAEAKRLTTLAEEAASQADAENKADLAKVEMGLRAKGFADLKAYEAALKVKTQETDKYCADKIAEANAISEAVDKEKQKVMYALAVVKAREAEVQKRVERAVATERSIAEVRGECDNWFGALQSQARYHRQHILPCRKAIDLARKSIYNFAGDIEAITKIDITPLYNFLGKQGKELDFYMDSTKAGIPEGVQKIVADEEAKDKELDGLLKGGDTK